jgi:hypothetical protein
MHPDWLPVYVRHGAENETAEMDALHNLAILDDRFRPVVVRGPSIPRVHPDGHLDYRNLLLLTTALARFPRVTAVAYGALLGEASGDKSPAFCRALERVWWESEHRRVQVLRPLRHMTKARALKLGMGLPGGHVLCSSTVSCYHGNHCGRCQACFRLGIAMYLCGISETMPQFPSETLGIRAALRSAPLRRWPSMALANLDVAQAMVVDLRQRAGRKVGKEN